MKVISIEIFSSEHCGYSVEVNGEVLMECLSESEVNDLTIEEIALLQMKVEKGLI